MPPLFHYLKGRRTFFGWWQVFPRNTNKEKALFGCLVTICDGQLKKGTLGEE